MLIDLLELASTDRVLAVATGTCHTALAVTPRVASVVRLDPNEEMLAEAGRLDGTRKDLKWPPH
jgi:ubiquinone/menaquinone biosynthesis C-methylase UbiE